MGRFGPAVLSSRDRWQDAVARQKPRWGGGFRDTEEIGLQT